MLRLDANFILEMINILVLFLILRKLLFRPIMDIMEKRRQRIETDLSDARKERESATALREEYESIKGQAKEESRQIISFAKEEAERESRQIMEEAQREAARQIQEAKVTIAEKEEQALLQAKAQVAMLAMEATKKLLEEQEASPYQAFVREEER